MSGQRRFEDQESTKESLPGPGQYNIAVKKKHRRGKTTFSMAK
jgi:hypothetical protein